MVTSPFTDRIIHSGDTDTAIRFPSNDIVTVETSGVERLRITAAGNIGIGTTTPGAKLEIAGTTKSSDFAAGDGTAKPQGDDIVRSKTIAKVTSTHVSHRYEDGSYTVPCVLMAY